jgi:esterase/lipase
MIKKIGISLLLLIAILAITYLLGPKPAPPTLTKNSLAPITQSLPALDSTIMANENAVKGLKPDNQARIVWADSSKKVRTKIVFLYIHGFSASQEEGDPVAANVAKKYGANLYLARVAEHGIDLGDSTLINFTANSAIASVEQALNIAKALGDEVHVMATSFGGALSLYLASKHPEIKSMVLYSPCIKTFDPTGELLDNPWGLQIARQVKKGLFNDITPKNADQPKYWSMHYRLEALVELQNFMTNLMTPETFKKVNCPIFLGYYYKNEAEQDHVVSVPALLDMYENLGTKNKEKMAFPNANNHVLASYVLSEDVKTVQEKTIEFLDKNINK